MSRGTPEQAAERGESVSQLIDRVRLGDEEAARILVANHERAIRMEARLRLRSSGLGGLVDSVDICQSVLGSFLVRAVQDRFTQMDDPQDLLRLLLRMARNKVIDQTRRHHAARRDVRKAQPLVSDGETAPSDTGLPPDEQVALNELLARAGGHLSPLERKVADRRAAGETWAAVGAELNLKPETVRRSFRRSAKRVSRELRLLAE